jgi:hypothetical protein
MTSRTTPYLKSKDVGKNSMVHKSEKYGRLPIHMVSQVLRNMAKAKQPEVKSPGVQTVVRGIRSLKLPPHNISMYKFRMEKSEVVCHLIMNQGKVMSNCLSYAMFPVREHWIT